MNYPRPALINGLLIFDVPFYLQNINAQLKQKNVIIFDSVFVLHRLYVILFHSFIDFGRNEVR